MLEAAVDGSSSFSDLLGRERCEDLIDGSLFDEAFFVEALALVVVVVDDDAFNGFFDDFETCFELEFF